MFARHSRSYCGFSNIWFYGRVDVYILDGCGGDGGIWYTDDSDSWDILYQGYDGSGLLRDTAGDGDGESDADGSDHQPGGGVFARHSRSYGWVSDGGLDGRVDIHLLDRCRGNGGVWYADDSISWDILYQGYDWGGLL